MAHVEVGTWDKRWISLAYMEYRMIPLVIVSLEHLDEADLLVQLTACSHWSEVCSTPRVPWLIGRCQKPSLAWLSHTPYRIMLGRQNNMPIGESMLYAISRVISVFCVSGNVVT